MYMRAQQNPCLVTPEHFSLSGLFFIRTTTTHLDSNPLGGCTTKLWKRTIENTTLNLIFKQSPTELDSFNV